MRIEFDAGKLFFDIVDRIGAIVKIKSPGRDLNTRPSDYKSLALPV